MKFSLGYVMIALISLQVMAQPDPSPASLHRISFSSLLDGSERQYFLYLPTGYEDDSHYQWPTLMFLHGNGERGNGLDELDYTLIHGPLYEAWVQKRDLPFVMIVPQLPMFGRDTMGITYIDNRTRDAIPQRLADGVPKRADASQSDTPMEGASPFANFAEREAVLPAGWDLIERDLIQMLDHVTQEYRTDPARFYLSGLSYGGFGTWFMASKYPERFAAIVPVVGWGHPSLMPSIAKHQVPVWAFAGGRDPVIEAKYFFGGMNTLEKLGHKNVRFTIHEDMSHDTWKRVYGGQDVYDWLLSQTKED